jgi:hypothetical protein
MKYFLCALLFLACSSTQPIVVNPTPPVPPTPIPTPIPPAPDKDTVHIHDTVTLTKTVTRTDTLLKDTIIANPAIPYVLLSPDPSGDSYLMLQTAINNYINRTAGWPKLMAGTYFISQPLIAAKIVGNDYVQVSLQMEGPAFAKNTPAAYMATIIPTYPDGFTLGIQKGKGFQIRNIYFQGIFNGPATYSQSQIDTLPFATWAAGISRTSPPAGIAIDFASDSVDFDSVTYRMYNRLHGYYLPGMSKGGSTAGQIIGCGFTNEAVDIIITPSNEQNGEEIDVIDCSGQSSISGVALTQAQSKACTVTRWQSWGGMHTVFDMAHWGFPHNQNNSLMVDVANIAGINHELVAGGAWTFPQTFKRVYAEGLFRIGSAGGFASTTFEDCDFELQCGAGTSSPDFIYNGNNTTWIGCQIRYYGYNSWRPVMNNATNKFEGGGFGTEPILSPLNLLNASMNPPIFSNVSMYYSPTAQVLNTTDYDSAGRTHTVTLHVDPGFVGWYIGQLDEVTGDVILTAKPYQDGYLAGETGPAIPVGNVYTTSGDTVFISNVGWGMHDGDVLSVMAAKYKAAFVP